MLTFTYCVCSVPEASSLPKGTRAVVFGTWIDVNQMKHEVEQEVGHDETLLGKLSAMPTDRTFGQACWANCREACPSLPSWVECLRAFESKERLQGLRFCWFCVHCRLWQVDSKKQPSIQRFGHKCQSRSKQHDLTTGAITSISFGWSHGKPGDLSWGCLRRWLIFFAEFCTFGATAKPLVNVVLSARRDISNNSDSLDLLLALRTIHTAGVYKVRSYPEQTQDPCGHDQRRKIAESTEFGPVGFFFYIFPFQAFGVNCKWRLLSWP